MSRKGGYQPPTDQHDGAVDTRCGVLRFKPKFLQPFASIGFFTTFYSMAALTTSTLSVYVNSQITTLERQFGFTSRQTGLIMAANDVGYLVCVLFVSYSASKVHIPRSLGIATIIFGLSGLICSLPHFVYGAELNTFGKDNGFDDDNITITYDIKGKGSNSNGNGQLCALDGQKDSSCESTSSNEMSTPEYVATVSLAIIFIGMMLQGFGKAPRTSFTLTYVDDNTNRVNTGFYMGIMTTFGIFGPAVAYLMGAIFSKVYVTLEKTKLTPSHPKWIGAWWLGYIVFGCIALVISIPLFCFPRKLPRAQKKEKKPVNVIFKGKNTKGSSKAIIEQHQHHNNNKVTSTDERLKHTLPLVRGKKIVQQMREFLNTFLRLLANPVYLCMVGSSCCIIFLVSGTGAYAPKYFERQFHLPAYKANYIMAGQTLFSACVGTFIGGYLTKRLKMTAMKALKFTIVVVTISLSGSISGFIFRCDQPEVHNFPGNVSECTESCNCEADSFFPICGDDGKTYYSPCTAGCSSFGEGVYSNCTCIPSGQATSGMCSYGCGHLYPYAIFSAIRSLFGTLSIMPKMIVYIRCVADKDKALALGLSAFMTSLLGWLLGPIVMGIVIDGICTVWNVECGKSGRCLLYDNDLFRIKLHGYATAAGTASLLCLITGYTYARCTGCLDKKIEEEVRNDYNSKFSAEMTLMVDDKGVVSELDSNGDIITTDGSGDPSSMSSLLENGNAKKNGDVNQRDNSQDVAAV